MPILCFSGEWRVALLENAVAINYSGELAGKAPELPLRFSGRLVKRFLHGPYDSFIQLMLSNS